MADGKRAKKKEKNEESFRTFRSLLQKTPQPFCVIMMRSGIQYLKTNITITKTLFNHQKEHKAHVFNHSTLIEASRSLRVLGQPIYIVSS